MVAATVLCVALAAQSTPPPPAPTALIVGRVVDAATGRPIPGAVVSLNGGTPGPFGPANISREPRAMTNGNGYFVFRRLAKGSYSLNATRPGYVDGAYGRRKPGGVSASLALEDGERIGDIVIPMWRHATISGTVTDEAGEPAIGVQVRSFQRRLTAGRYRMVQGPVATTDDRGQYRIAALQPGDYLVAFIWREASVPVATSELMRSITSGDAKTQEILRERINLGSSFGSAGSSSAIQVGSAVRDLPSGVPVPPSASDDTGVFIYPTQFYPGVPSTARATVITLTSGQQRESIDFSLRPVKTVRVSGTLLGPDGPMANAGLRLVPAGDDTIAELDTSATMSGDGGEFTFLGVPPGQYTVKVLRIPRPPAPALNTTAMTQIQVGSSMMMTTSSTSPASFPAVPDDPTLFAEVPVAVANRDVSDIIVPLQRGARVSGRFEFDGTRERPDAAALMRVPITLERADAVAPLMPFNTPPPGRADETGSFKTYGVAAGRYLVRVGGAPSGWTLKSVTSDGRDVSEVPLDLRSTDVANVVVTFTDRPTRLTGTARTAAGNLDADAVVIAFPADQSGWSDYGLNPRRVRSTHATRNGSYTITGLPPGDYYVAAIHDDTTPQWQDPRVLEDLARGASQVRLGDGDARTQDLKTVKGGSQ